jgi:hypothetical protein
LAGTLDLIFAFTFWGVSAHLSASRILQSIAAGVLGGASFSGGAWTATLGLGLHYSIIAAMVGTYYVMGLHVQRLVGNWGRYGAIYGLWLYVAMNYIVVPISRAGAGPNSRLWVTMSIAVHIVVGLACAWTAKRAIVERQCISPGDSARRPSETFQST